jgi:hypothetical protein
VFAQETSSRVPGRRAGWLGALARAAGEAQGRTAIACWVATLWAAVLLVRAHLVFTSPSVSLAVDEAYVAALAHRMLDGRMLPYVDGVSHRGPLLYWVASLFVYAGGQGWAGMRALALTVSLACSLFTFLAARRSGAPVAGAVGAWATPLVCLMVLGPGAGVAFTGEGLVNAFAMSGLFALTVGLVRPAGGVSRPWVAAAGALFMMAVLSKQSAALALIVPALWVLATARARPGAGGWRLVAVFAAGALAPAALVVLRYAAAGRLPTFWYYYVRYNLAVYMAPYAGVDRLHELRVWFSGNALVVGLGALLVCWGLAQVVLAVRAEGSLWRGLDRAGFVLAVALGAVCSVLGAKAALRDWGHYYVQTIPWFGLLLGLLLSPPGRGPRDHGPLVACALLLPLALLAESGWALRAPGHRAQTLASRPPSECALIQQHSRPGDRILVWGFWPSVYLDCQREPASRFVYTTIPAGVVPWFIGVPKSRDDELAAPGSREELIGDLEESQAALVLDNWFVDRPIRRYDLLARYLDQHYYFVGATGATRIYKRGKRDTRTLFDFEGPSLEGWTIEGDAFADSPKAGLAGQAPLTGQSGRTLINTFTRARSDAATGLALSPPFVLDRARFGLLVGGGVGCRIELRIEGGPALEQKQEPTTAEHLFEVGWDVRAHRGRSARLAVIDEGTAPWGHCLVDRVELFDTAD